MSKDQNIEIIATVSKNLPEVMQEADNAIVVKGDGFLHIHGTNTLKLEQVNQMIDKYYPADGAGK